MAHFNFVISQNAKWGHAGTGKYSFTKKALYVLYEIVQMH